MFFVLSESALSTTPGTVRIRLLESKPEDPEAPAAWLQIGYATSVSIRDEDDIDAYELEYIELDTEGARVILHGCPGCELVVTVSGVDVAVLSGPPRR